MNQNNSIRLTLPADHKYLNVLSTCIAAMLERVEGLTEPTLVSYNIQLAVQETATNIVRHAYANLPNGEFDVTLRHELTPHRFIIEIHDTGQSFNPTDVPELDLDEPPEGGMGLFLIQQLMDEVTYQAGPPSNCWRLVKNL